MIRGVSRGRPATGHRPSRGSLSVSRPPLPASSHPPPRPPCCPQPRSRAVESLLISGQSPNARGYHTWNTLGSRCYLIGGRVELGCIKGRQKVAVLDLDTNTWTLPFDGGGGGDLGPVARSSHRAVSLRDRIVIHGERREEEEEEEEEEDRFYSP